MSYLEPWKELEQINCSDQLKRFVHQNEEDRRVSSLPHVLKPLPAKATVMGQDSPHQTGDLTSYDILTRAPLYFFASHVVEIPPHVPVRGVHRHLAAPTIFCFRGKGWEWNDGVTYEFETYDMVCFPPYSTHQHGGDREVGCGMISLATRLFHMLGLMWREQHKLSEKPVFPEGTEPIYDDAGKLQGYRIKKGVLGVEKDVEVVVGADSRLEVVFRVRKEAGAWSETVANTYDRYTKLFHDEVSYLGRVDHVVHERREDWEWSRHGKIKWLIHPEIETGAKQVWVYLQEIPAGSRSGMHRHIAEEQIMVLEGKGYDLHDGVRWDWEQGDFICIPRMTAHQHFVAGENRAVLLCAMPSPPTVLGLGGIEQLEDAPEYQSVA
ncbi:MAG: cupin domain-containing protein [Deltaproteobacteria bacterium]|nr:cupin domain-containing protein [Deltaproteobacteria bacterium]